MNFHPHLHVRIMSPKAHLHKLMRLTMLALMLSNLGHKQPFHPSSSLQILPRSMQAICRLYKSSKSRLP